MDEQLTKKGNIEFQTTESKENFENKAAVFLGEKVVAKHIHF
jgi:hypothetical protein